jgi:phosphatidylethanolamine/phosphatidyl-N-methylethanolamine N-methyltransferase
MTTDIDKQAVTKVYGRWAPVYDLVFGAVFEQGRRAAIAASERVGGRILEVGVGTGISLPYYSRNSQVFCIDLRADAAEGAVVAVVARHLRNVERLAVMDAERLEFPDDSFDVVIAQYVVTTVPHPRLLWDEFARVLEAGRRDRAVSIGWAPTPDRARVFEHLFQPFANKLGWRSEFPSFVLPIGRESTPAWHAPHRAPPDATTWPLRIRFGKTANGVGRLGRYRAAEGGPDDNHHQITTGD